MKIMLLLLLAGCASVPEYKKPGDVCEVVGLYCFDPEAK